jgi:hypothetical protein
MQILIALPNPNANFVGRNDVTTIDQTEARLNTHEEVCALRYDGICARLKRLENVGLAVAGAIIMMLLSILVKMN